MQSDPEARAELVGTAIALGDRVVTAALSAFFMAVMAVCVPIGLAILSRGRGLSVLATFGTFHVWGGAVITLAGLVGFVLGTDRTVVLFGHLWGTEEPRNEALTVGLWSILIGLALASYWLFRKYHAPV